jgi:Zn-dependent metalloprotease
VRRIFVLGAAAAVVLSIPAVPASAAPAAAAAPGAGRPAAAADGFREQAVRYLVDTPWSGRPTVLSGHIDAGAAVPGERVSGGAGRGALYRKVTIQTHLRPDGTFSMTDPTRAGISCRNFTSGAVLTGRDDVWGNYDGTRIETGCVDALYSVQRLWDMFREWFGRDGIDGNGNGFPLLVGLNAVTAFWSGSYVAIGRNTANRFIGSLDVVGHEFGHALDAYTPGGRSGNGVSEATGDIIGTSLEFFADDPHDPPDFSIGEKINLVGTGPYRQMYDPSLVGDPNCYSDSIRTMEAHAAAGPFDHWFTLLAKGSEAGGGQPASPTCDGATVTGVGVPTAARIFYTAMLSKTTGMTYLDYRTATLNSAMALFPGDCVAVDAVRAAWDAVSVPPQLSDPTCGNAT